MLQIGIPAVVKALKQRAVWCEREAGKRFVLDESVVTMESEIGRMPVRDLSAISKVANELVEVEFVESMQRLAVILEEVLPPSDQPIEPVYPFCIPIKAKQAVDVTAVVRPDVALGEKRVWKEVIQSPEDNIPVRNTPVIRVGKDVRKYVSERRVIITRELDWKAVEIETIPCDDSASIQHAGVKVRERHRNNLHIATRLVLSVGEYFEVPPVRR